MAQTLLSSDSQLPVAQERKDKIEIQVQEQVVPISRDVGAQEGYKVPNKKAGRKPLKEPRNVQLSLKVSEQLNEFIEEVMEDLERNRNDALNIILKRAMKHWDTIK